MPNQPTIRRAELGDASVISRLLHEAFVEYRALYTSEGFAATAISTSYVLKRMAEGPMWVAELGNQIIGTVSIVVHGRSLYIRGMAVTPSARGKQIGKSLLLTIEQFAGSEGCTRMHLSTTPFLDRAIRLYEEFGFRRIVGGPNDLLGTPLFTMEKQIGPLRHGSRNGQCD